MFLLPIWVKMGKYTIISYIVIFEWNIWYFKLFYYIYYIYLISYLIFSKTNKSKNKTENQSNSNCFKLDRIKFLN